jgi:DNA-binding NarL/FixJ family response regulator
VLIVDDNDDLVRVIRVFLEMDDRFSVVGVASDGDEALDMARELEPDAVLVDDQMPRRSGLSILPELRATLPSARIVLHTAYPRGLGIELGADQEIAKAMVGLDAVADSLWRGDASTPYDG